MVEVKRESERVRRWESGGVSRTYLLNTPLSFAVNPHGTGLMMMVERGIPCAENTQLFSAHCTNTPDEESVFDELDQNAKWYEEMWSAFVGLYRAGGEKFATRSHPSDMAKLIGDDETKRLVDVIGSMVCQQLVETVTERSERRADQMSEEDSAELERLHRESATIQSVQELWAAYTGPAD